MYRLKTIFTGEVCARKLETQTTELMIECKALNQMTQLGMPESYPVKLRKRLQKAGFSSFLIHATKPV